MTNTNKNRPGYKKTKIGWIPVDWDVKKLDELTSKISDGIHTTPKYVDSSTFYFINGNNLINNSICINENTKCVSRAEYEKFRKPLNENTILLSINGTIGNIAFFNNETVILGKSAAFINVNLKANKNYLFYIFQSDKTISYFDNEVTGSTIRNLSLKSIKETLIPLPPLPEQKKIAEILSTWDKAISNYELLIKNYELRKKALMQKLLTGKVRFKEFEGQEWKNVRLGKIVDAFSGGTPSRDRKEFYNGNIPWIKSGELNNTRIYSTEESISKLGLANSSAKMVNSGTILIALYGATAGVVGITEIDASINQAILAVIPNQSIDKQLLYYIFVKKMPKIVNNMVQGGQPNLSGSIVKSIKIIYPELVEEQRKIASVLTAQDKQIDLLKEQKAALEQQKKGLMQKLLTGEVRVKVS